MTCEFYKICKVYSPRDIDCQGYGGRCNVYDYKVKLFHGGVKYEHRHRSSKLEAEAQKKDN